MGNVGAGYIGNTGVLLCDSPDQAEPVAEAMRQRCGARAERPCARRVVRTIHPCRRRSRRRSSIPARIRQKIDAHRDLGERRRVARSGGFRPPDYLRPFHPDDLPRLVREAFTEVDDTRGCPYRHGMPTTPTIRTGTATICCVRAKALRVEALGRTWAASAERSLAA